MSLSPARLWSLSARTTFALILSLLVAGAPVRGAFAADTKPTKEPAHAPALEKPVPESIDDLKVIQKQVKTVLEKVVPCTVGLQVNAKNGQSWQGSGVIVREDGYILSACHVSLGLDQGGGLDNDVTVIMPDGKKLKAKALGGNSGIDSGLIKITTEGKYPFVEMGNSKEVKNGDWCVCTGHPGGYKDGRSPVVRVGRILAHNDNHLQSDCTMVGGDSGGPLFDIDGKVIGINSRIAPSIQSNIHVPVDTFRDTWERLDKGEVWGPARMLGNPNGPYLGFTLSDDNDTKIVTVAKNSPADKAGIKVGDVIQKFDGEKVSNSDELRTIFRKKKVGDEVEIEVLRDKETLKFKVVLTKKPA
jgi:serine protease Do